VAHSRPRGERFARAKHTCRKLFSRARKDFSRAPRNRFIPCFTASRAPRAHQTARPISHHPPKKPLTRFFRITKLAHEKGGDASAMAKKAAKKSSKKTTKKTTKKK
jgi:hypothetical protein